MQKKLVQSSIFKIKKQELKIFSKAVKLDISNVKISTD